MKKPLIIIGIVLLVIGTFLIIRNYNLKQAIEEEEEEIETEEMVTSEVEEAVDDTVEVKADSINAKPKVTLKLVVNDLTSASAPVVVHVYKSNKHFLKPKGRVKVYKFTPNSTTLNATLEGLKFGEYAIVIYQDMNSNGIMDRNVFGLPTEGYALSNNFRPKTGAPNYDDCKFKFSESLDLVSVNLID